MERKKAIEVVKKNWPDSRFTWLREALETLIPELKESEDERIRKEMISYFKQINYNNAHTWNGINLNKFIAWLEEQGSEPNWCHHKVDLSECSEEYRKAYYDGWNNCNMQHSQCKSELDDVVKCLINGMKFYYEDNEKATWGTDKWSMPVKHIIEVLENQGEQKPAEWSEEDAMQLDAAIHLVSSTGHDATANWLKNLKERKLPLPKQEYDDMAYEMARAVLYDKLKSSLRPQNTWKPSEEQMEVLAWCRPLFADPKSKGILKSLIEDLKKLREE